MVWAHDDAGIEAALRYDRMENERTRKGSARLLRALWRDHAPILRHLRGLHSPKRGPFQPPRRATDLVAQVARAFGFKAEEITGKVRRENYVDARAVAAKLLRERNYSYPQIGIVLGNRDHSTVINLLDKFDIYERRNPLVGATYEEFRVRR